MEKFIIMNLANANCWQASSIYISYFPRQKIELFIQLETKFI